MNTQEFDREKLTLQKQFSRESKKLQKKVKEVSESLEQSKQWSKHQHEGDLIKANLASIKKGSSSALLHDWVTDQPYQLSLDSRRSPYEEMAARYKKARKLQAGIIPLSRFLEEIQAKLLRLEQLQHELDLIKTVEELAEFKGPFSISKEQKKREKTEPSQPIYKEYVAASGLKIWVGKSAKSNDYLTFVLANGRDWWLHARGYSGSHVVIRIPKEGEPDQETLQDAMQLALYHSKGRSQGEGEICFTQRKYVSRAGRGGKAGLVQVSKHDVAWIRLDLQRIQTIQKRNRQELF